MNFQEHEALDKAGALVTATVSTADGSITGMSLSYEGATGLVPVTVPTDSADAVSAARYCQIFIKRFRTAKCNPVFMFGPFGGPLAPLFCLASVS